MDVNKAVKKSVGRWSGQERSRFSEALVLFGQDWELVEDYVATRSTNQILNYAFKLFPGNQELRELTRKDKSNETKDQKNIAINKRAALKSIKGDKKTQKS